MLLNRFLARGKNLELLTWIVTVLSARQVWAARAHYWKNPAGIFDSKAYCSLYTLTFTRTHSFPPFKPRKALPLAYEA